MEKPLVIICFLRIFRVSRILLYVDFGTYDFIIVGAGTAGGIVANRLSEIEHFKVLLVEAGKADPPISKVLGLYGYLASSEYNWGYYTTPQEYACLGLPV